MTDKEATILFESKRLSARYVILLHQLIILDLSVCYLRFFLTTDTGSVGKFLCCSQKRQSQSVNSFCFLPRVFFFVISTFSPIVLAKL